jgi:hypothetical protein
MTAYCSRAPDPLLHFILCDFGKTGREWIARDITRMNRADTVEDIRSGEIKNVVRVLECSLEGPICFDRTEDILREAGRWNDADPPLSGTERVNWLHDHRQSYRKNEVA